MRRGELLSAAAGAMLLATLFLPWYGLDLDGRATADAWQAFGVIDVVLFATAVAAITLPIARGRARWLIAGLAALALLLVVARIIDPPGRGLGLRSGAPLGL